MTMIRKRAKWDDQSTQLLDNRRTYLTKFAYQTKDVSMRVRASMRMRHHMQQKNETEVR